MSVWAESKINIDLHDLNWVAATGDMCQCECVRRFFQRKPDRPPSNCSHSSVFPTMPSQYFPPFHLSISHCSICTNSANCTGWVPTVPTSSGDNTLHNPTIWWLKDWNMFRCLFLNTVCSHVTWRREKQNLKCDGRVQNLSAKRTIFPFPNYY